ncbi:hypothetical protein DFP72DRAFT_906524 [Ephemerocybe angulata]|uniref:DUF6534 domain-containing protein n=1 Tax=Ephemerocybe angulata TaxID=980116 RepID=A0A8H6M2D7_9AGAR|nr:hypothetical protein DFP72DRAFT_906524 [Tulosesus angulatus]
MSDPGCIPRPTVDLGPYAGVELLGIFAAMALWGVTCMQTFLYFFNIDPRDTWKLKALVIWLWLMDTGHQALLISGNYKATVSGDTLNLGNNRVEYVISILFTTMVSVPVQVFFAWRIWKLGTVARYIFLAILLPAIIFQFVEGLLLLIYNSQLSRPDEVTAKLGLALIIANLTVGAAVDIVIAAGLCTLLWRTYLLNGVTIKATSSMIHRLILFSVNTGLWTASFAIVTMAMAAKYPSNYMYIGFYFILSPLYCNMFLANLNARAYIRGGDIVANSDTREGMIDFNKTVPSGFMLRELGSGLSSNGRTEKTSTFDTKTGAGTFVGVDKREKQEASSTSIPGEEKHSPV